eukprot:NODE_256_length_12667_cov_0.196292.p10 type:complete len:116 gc:universal NODE_256_length_12667_cov_0.196292:6047-5700(-)
MSNQLYSPVKQLNFELKVPVLEDDYENLQSSNPNKVNIPITVTGPEHVDNTYNRLDTTMVTEAIQNELNSFCLDKFAGKPWNCLNSEDLSIMNPEESQINFNRNAFRALDMIKDL